MIRLAFFFIKLALLVAAAVWLANHPGQVTFVWQGYEVSTSVAVVIVVLLLAIILSIALYSLWRALVGIPQSLSLTHASYRQRKGYVALTEGLMAIAAGDGAAARKQAQRAEKLLNKPPLALLLQAQAAQLSGDDNAASRFYSQMLEKPEMSFLGLRGLIEQSRKQGDQTQALQLARRAQLLQPKADWVAALLVDLEARSGNWSAALEALTRAGRLGAFPPERVKKLRAALWLAQSHSAEQRGLKEDALTEARRAHELLPAFSPATAAYARLLLENGQSKLAAKIIERSWRLYPHPDLVPLYERAGGSITPVAQVKHFERLASFSPESAESHLAVGQAALKAQLWGIARAELDKALLNKTTEGRAAKLLAELSERESHDPAAARVWLERANQAPVAPGYACTSCQSSQAHWSVHCPSCQGLATVEWQRGKETSPRTLAATSAGTLLKLTQR